MEPVGCPECHAKGENAQDDCENNLAFEDCKEKMRFVRWAASRRMMVLNFIVDVLPKPNTGSTKLIVKPTRGPVS